MKYFEIFFDTLKKGALSRVQITRMSFMAVWENFKKQKIQNLPSLHVHNIFLKFVSTTNLSKVLQTFKPKQTSKTILSIMLTKFKQTTNKSNNKTDNK